MLVLVVVVIVTEAVVSNSHDSRRKTIKAEERHFPVTPSQLGRCGVHMNGVQEQPSVKGSR